MYGSVQNTINMESHKPDNPCMTFRCHPVDGSDTISSRDVPELDGTIQRAADDTNHIKLQTSYGVSMSAEGVGTLAFKTP